MSMRRFSTGFCLWAASSHVFAHGVIENPPSRNWFCGAVTTPDQVNQGKGTYPQCSAAYTVNPIAAYNFMAVVTHSLGRAKVTPLPKNVCGFDGEYWNGAQTPWDVPMDWPANPMSAGPKTFTWNITWGPHFSDTFEFRYWITKADFAFSPAKALTWDDFEAEAFCVDGYDDNNPAATPNVTTDKAKNLFFTRCEIPARKGHHVIYAEWGRSAPTLERFHGCVDAAFAGSAIRAPRHPGSAGTRLSAPGNKPADLLGRTGKAASGHLLLYR